MAQLQAGELKLIGHVAHILPGGREQIHPARPELFRFGLREIAPITDDDPVLHPARERIEQLPIIDRGRGQIKPAEPPRLIALDVELEAIPPPHAVLGLARPGAKGSVLTDTSDVTDRNRGGVLQDDGIEALGLAVAV